VYGDDEIESGEDGGESVDENTDDSRSDGGIRIDAAERRIKGPAGIEAAGGEGVENKGAADDVDVPTEEIDFGESEVFRADHKGHEEITEDGGNGGNEEEENHGHAVHGEELVVGFGGDQVTRWSQQVDTDHGGEDAANEKEEGDGSEIEQGDALVVGGEKPGANAVGGIKIMLFRQLQGSGILWCRAHDLFFPCSYNARASRGNGLRLKRFDVGGKTQNLFFGQLALESGHKRLITSNNFGAGSEDGFADVGFIGDNG